MKTIQNWLRAFSLQGRLFVVFTVIFIGGVVCLSGFSQMNAMLMVYNARLRDEFGRTQKVYRLLAMFQTLQVDERRYALTTDVELQIEFNNYNARMGDLIQDMLDDEARQPGDNSSTVINHLQQLQQLAPQYAAVFDQLVEARNADEYETVAQLDEQASKISDQMTDEMDALAENGAAKLQVIQTELELFNTVAVVAIFFTLPVFLLVMGMAVVLIHFQINRPLEVLMRAVADLEAGRFDPAKLQKLAARKDEVGAMATEVSQMAQAAIDRRAALRAQADEIRRRIR